MPARQPASTETKALRVQGRRETAVVREYLEALRQHKPVRGPRRTPDTIAKRLNTIASALTSADAVTELRLTQERINLEAELEQLTNRVDLADVENAFIQVAASYSTRHGVSYTAWRTIGVSPAVLKAAGVR